MTLQSLVRCIALVFFALLGAPPAQAQRMHYLGIAGANDDPVFSSEVSGAGRTIGAVWTLASSRLVGAAGRRGSSYEAIRQAIRQAGEGMDRDRDVLFLVLSSHGARDGRGLELTGRRGLTPRMLRAALDEAGIRNRVVLISACFSGQFVRPLADPRTAVITAANATNFAFGCPTGCRYTDFGGAFFDRGLPHAGRDLGRAFALARADATSLARRYGQRPSDPQFSMGAELAQTLQAIR